MQRDRIENKIVNLVKAGKFYAITRSATKVVTTDTATSIQPASIRVNETRCRFEKNAHVGLRDATKRADWGWELLLEWNREVTLEAFEESLMDKTIWIPLDGTMKATRLALASCVTTHPVQQQSAKGTRAKLTFKVEEIS